MSRFAHHPSRNAWIIAVIWTVALICSLVWTVSLENRQALQLATHSANSNFDKDLAYRAWASGHGGVYVPPTEHTPPSPWMAHIPDRDVVTTDGKQLTLMNPAYMLRQMMDEFGDLYGVKGRIVGRIALNPNNLADNWESEAIGLFQKGSTEVLAKSDIEGKPYLRLIKPMWMEPSCMKCHGHLGFKVGEIRGAVSVSVPMEPYLLAASEKNRNVTVIHLVIWLISISALILTSRRTNRLERERQAMFDETQLASKVFEDGLEGVLITDAQGTIVRVNPAFTQMTGFSALESIGHKPNILRSGHHDVLFYENLWRALLNQGRWEGEIWNRRKNGETFVAMETISAVRSLSGRVSHYISIIRDITERIQVQERMRYLAHYDPLTQLPNRTLFAERLEQATQRAGRDNSQLTVLFIDLDYFKAVNDSLGHAAGDELLCALAQRIRELLQKSDIVARLSGDEFAVCIENSHSYPHPHSESQGGIDTLLVMLLNVLQAPTEICGRSVTISASIGIAIFPQDGTNAETLLRAADTAMYRAKEKGRGCFAYYQAAFSDQADDRFTVISELRHGLEHGEFRLYYQPKVDATTRQLTGVEALVRWQHPTKGMIPPDRFIPLVEQTDLIIPLGAWVLQTACEQAPAWNTHVHFQNIKMAVNVSGVQVARPGLLEQVKEILARTGLAPKQLELEVTEGVMIKGEADGFKTLSALRELGVGIAIDDFGTGYSSLAILKQLPITRLKIDRSFVSNLPESKDDLAIARMITHMAENLQLNVTAEGVETEAQVDCLRGMGCHELQGYYFSRPLPPEALEALWPTNTACAKVDAQFT